jgi:hypothetical protein
MSEPKEEGIQRPLQAVPASGSGGDTHELTALAAVLPEVIASFQKLSAEGRRRLLETVTTFFGIERTSLKTATSTREAGPSFSEDRSISPKEFLRQKQPRTDVERVACLAYYLTHYRDTPHFKTLDISQLNTDAAQVKFTNAANSVNNASTYGYLAATTKGNKQLTSAGEAFVEALPDREAAKEAMANARPRRRRKASDKRNDDDKELSVTQDDDGKAP